MSASVAKELGTLLGSRLSIERIDLGLLNRIIIHNLLLDDQNGEELLKATRLSAKFDITPLFRGKISISNVQLFGFNIQLNREHPEATPNFQFVLDALASKDDKPKESHLDLRINSILIRRGRISYDVRSEAETPGKFNASHLRLRNIRANVSLKALQNDSINAAIKRLGVEEEHSGFELKALDLKIIGNQQGTHIDNFSIALPHTYLCTDTIRLEYDSLAAFKDFARQVRFSFHLQPSQISLQDLAAFVPTFASFKEEISVEVLTSGTFDQLECPVLSVSSSNHFRLMGHLSLQNLSNPEEAYVAGNFSQLYADQEGIGFFLHNFNSNQQGIPTPLRQLGTVQFTGEIAGHLTNLSTSGLVRTDLGKVKSDLKLKSDKEKGVFAYAGGIQTEEFEIGKLLSNPQLGNVTFNLQIDGRHGQGRYPTILMNGLVSSIEYGGHTYEEIRLDGAYDKGGFNGQLSLNDPDAALQINGSINTASSLPTFNFQASLDHFRPHKLGLTPTKYEESELSVKLKADFTGGSIDEMKGEINIDSLTFHSPDKRYFLDNLKIASTRESASQKHLTISSTFLQGNIDGDYSYHTLPASLQNILHRYLPSVAPASKQSEQTDNNFRFSLHVYDTELLSALSLFPLKVYTHSTLQGYVNDKAERMRIEGYFPRLRYKEKYIESGMLLCENSNDRFHTHLRFSERKSEGTVNVVMEAEAKNDSLQATLNWGNNRSTTYCGKLSALTHFIRPQEEASARSHRKEAPLKAHIDIQPTQIILNDTLWQIHPSKILIDSGKVHVNNFYFSHKDRHLRINGTLSKLPQDTVRLDLKDINIGYVFDIADLGVNFKGEATGPAYASGVLEHPVMNTDLFIRNLGLNDGLLGDSHIHGEWHHDVKGILLDAQIQEKDIAHTHVHGFVYPLKPTSALDLQIEADSTNLKFIHYFMGDITPDFHGRGTGHVHLYGKFKALTMEGRVFGDASFKIDVLNTTLSVKDSIFIEPGGLTFKDNRVFDPQGHQGRMNGYVHYRHFKDISYRFNFDLANMLIMNTKESPDMPFYGTIYGNGTATLSGSGPEGMNIDLALTTGRNSTFTYIKDNVTTAISNQFIKFVDKTPQRTLQDPILLTDFELRPQEQQEDEGGDTDIRLNLQVDVTPDATMKIVMDPAAGDYISGRGSGNIRTEFYNKGDIKMFGNYRINHGVYKFSLQEVIRKDFTIKEGSTLSFNGAPSEANLDIQASYTVNSASLNDLMPARATEYMSQTNVKVNCIMNLSGQLTAPDIKLDIELPNERDEVQALVRNYIPTDEQMNMQILYLLGIGKFYTPDYADVTQNSDMMSSVLSSTLSGQLNNALSNLINNNNWNIGTNLSTGERGWTDVEFEGILSGQLLNNRLLINGNFGYRDNPLANTNFVGDFEAEWLVNRSGDIRLKAYNETNDRYYTRTNLTTQGIGIIFKKDFNKWNELLFWNRWKLRRLKAGKTLTTPSDSLSTSPSLPEAQSKRERNQ